MRKPPSMLSTASSRLLRSTTLRSLQSFDIEEGYRAEDEDKKIQNPIGRRFFSSSSFFSSSLSSSSSSSSTNSSSCSSSLPHWTTSCFCCFSSLHSFVLALPLFHMIFFPSFFLLHSFRLHLFRNMVVAVAIIAGGFLFARRLRMPRFLAGHGVRTGMPVEWFIGDEEWSTKKANKCSGDGGSANSEGFREKVEVYTNGDCYEGEFYGGCYSGSGVYTSTNVRRYEGDWVEGNCDGYGVESWTRGNRYHGQYRQGRRHGFGLYQFCTGDTYAGGWLNGQSHGVGSQNCSDSSFYDGEFVCGVKHGLGCYHFRNGDRYCGEYFWGKLHGYGVYQFGNGHCYEGSWHEGKRHGYGTYTFQIGESVAGEWAYGHPHTLRHPSDEAVQRAVKSARRAAANAIGIPRVDERVKNSIAAANRAATASRVASVRAVQNQEDHR